MHFAIFYSQFQQNKNSTSGVLFVENPIRLDMFVDNTCWYMYFNISQTNAFNCSWHIPQMIKLIIASLEGINHGDIL